MLRLAQLSTARIRHGEADRDQLNSTKSEIARQTKMIGYQIISIIAVEDDGATLRN